VVVVQGDAINRSRISTVICVPLTSNLKWAAAPGNVALSAEQTGLPKDSVANVSQIVTIDKDLLSNRVGKLPRRNLLLLLSGIDVILGNNPGRLPAVITTCPEPTRQGSALYRKDGTNPVPLSPL